MRKSLFFFGVFLLCLVISFAAYSQNDLSFINDPKALTILEENLQLEEGAEVFNLEQRAYQLLSATYEKQGDYKKALHYANRLNELEDRLYSEYIALENNSIKARYQTLQQADSIAVLQANQLTSTALISKQETILKAIISCFIFLLIVLSLLFYIFKIKRDKSQQFSEMKVQIEKKNQLLKERKEKIETLNEELSHRVKNNLMFVSSLMRLQGRRLENPEAKAAIKEAENRVEAMAMVHRRLYEQEEIITVEMREYLTQLGEYLLKSYAAIDSTPIIKLNFENLTLESDAAVQIGLIVNELMTNSFKHAFKKQDHPAIIIDMVKNEDHTMHLVYSDNGVGVPFDFDLKRSDSLGLRLIHDLTEQLNGTVEISNQDGAYFQFEFAEIKITG